MTKDNKKYVIMVLSCEACPYNILEQAQRNTWASDKSIPELDTIFYHANINNPTCWNGDSLTIQAIESFDSLSKSMIAIEEVLNMYKNASYIFFTNASSYIIKHKIIDIFKTLPIQKAYSGLIGVDKNTTFASGSGFFMSRDLCEDIIKNKHLFPDHCWGDLEFGKYFGKKGIPIIPQNRYDLDMEWDKAINITYENIKNHFHIRCKRSEDRNRDVILMNKIFKLINNNLLQKS
jgi:hypothetical protein